MVRRAACARSEGNGERGHRRAEDRGELRHARLGSRARRVDHVQRRLQGHAGAPAPAARTIARRLTMATMTMVQAIRSALDVMLERDPNVVVFGEDVGYFGGV